MEPIGNDSYVCWITGNETTPPDRLRLTSNLSLGQRTNIKDPIVSETYGAGRFGFWFFEKDNPQSGLNWIIRQGGHVLHSSIIQMAQHVEYTIYGAVMPPLDMNEILSEERLRYFYMESVTPVPEDEMSALQILVNLMDPTMDMSLFRETRRLNVDGGRILTGIIDTGLDNNDNDTCHPDLRGRLNRSIRYPGSPGFDYVGHGTHIAGIIAGNGALGSVDEYGFRLGVGLSPANFLVVSDALLAAPFPPSTGFPGMIRDIALSGARLCNNSWNDGQGTAVGYHPNCAIWDAAVRDSDPYHTYSSQWPITIIFSAGNQGPDPYTITSPKEAKNIITVGATGSLRNGNPDEVLNISSRGPCEDGRYAPTLCAPGETIYSAWPIDSYLTASGSSAAAAHVTGAAVLITEWWKDRTHRLPSPALMKGILIQSTIPVQSVIPDSAQGWGRLVMSSYQPTFPAASILDQSKILTPTSNEWHAEIIPMEGSDPVDIVLTWTDSPAAPGANPALINDLDLILIAGETYRGNNFNETYSIPEGDPDRINNLERIRLEHLSVPAHLSVYGHNLRGDGVPLSPDPVDQDFALAVKGAFLVSSDCTIQTDLITASDNSRVTVLATSEADRYASVFPVNIKSWADPDGIIVALQPYFEESGVFAGVFFTGHRNRPNEIEVGDIDQITISASCNGNPVRHWLNTDSTKPRFESIQFNYLTDRDVTLSINCSENCELVFFYSVEKADQWLSKTSPLLSSSHIIKINNLIPCTDYKAYFSMTDRSGNVTCSREYIDDMHWSTSDLVLVYEESFNDNPGFVQLDDQWEWGSPQGLGNPPDPVAGYTGDYVLGYNLQGNYSNQMNARYATSPSIDCSPEAVYRLKLYRWLGTENGLFDQASISVNSRENEWVNIWSNPYYEITDTEWVPMEFDVTQQASGNAEFQFRFQQGPTDTGITRCGWNIDDISLECCIPCQPTPTPLISDDKPSLTLVLNNHIFFPSDEFTLGCRVTSAGPMSQLALVVRLTVLDDEENLYFFYPEWQSLPQWVDIPQPQSGSYSIMLTEFSVPPSINQTIYTVFEAWLIDSQYNNLLSSSGKSIAVFQPDFTAQLK
ncbi:S8 family serine peptidase [bacterium]|nr:S8 family serine peptidase [candidate division CSSED10-310 bacterium]